MSNVIYIKSNKSAKQARIILVDDVYEVTYGGTADCGFLANLYDDVKEYKTLKNAIKYAKIHVNK